MAVTEQRSDRLKSKVYVVMTRFEVKLSEMHQRCINGMADVQNDSAEGAIKSSEMLRDFKETR